MIDWTPNPSAFSLGPIEVRSYGLAYVSAAPRPALRTPEAA